MLQLYLRVFDFDMGGSHAVFQAFSAESSIQDLKDAEFRAEMFQVAAKRQPRRPEVSRR